MIDPAKVDWEKGGGLVPAIVQDARDGSVLMLGYMNREALAASAASGRVTFWSRSKRRLWSKGESSGHHLDLREIKVDCDGDTLLVTALPNGPVCHTGTRSCFGDGPAQPPAGDPAFLERLEQIIRQRMAAKPEGSYTAKLLGEGVRRVAQKVGEEGLEVALAAVAQPDAQIVGEAADLVYHLLVLLQAKNLTLKDVVAELQLRHEAAAGAEHQR
jgi:phosphoribosyl-ATP pyrophosphohydrolase/phosphoribosyl-AMP cyclohydrolase